MAWVFNPFTGTFDFTNTGGGGGGSPGGSSGQVQYNNGGAFGGMSGTTWTDASQSLAIASTGTGTGITTSSPVLNLSQTWNDGTVTFTGLKFNATDTASASGSLLLDLQVGGTSKVSVSKNAQITAANTGGVTLRLDNVTANYWDIFSNSFLRFSRGPTGYFYIDANGNVTISDAKFFAFGSADTGAGQTFLRGPAAATLQLGAADAAAPVAQFFKVQGVVAGTTNTAGANFTIQGSQGTGTGAGGSIIFQVAPAGSSGTAQNAYSTALTLTSSGTASFAANTVISGTFFLNSDASGNDYFLGTNLYGRKKLGVSADATIGWTSVNGTPNGTNDVILARDAANTLALRNGTNAQTFRVYNTFTSFGSGTEIWERGAIEWSSNVLRIATSAGANGGSVRPIEVQVGTGRKFSFTTVASFELFNSTTRESYQGWDAFQVRSDTFIGWSSGTTVTQGQGDTNFIRTGVAIIGVRGANTTTGGALSFIEQTAPAAPAANGVYIYAEDNGSGKTRLMALFATGAAQQIAIEP